MEIKYLLIITGVMFALLMALGILSGNAILASNLFFIGLAIVIVPYMLHKFFEFKKLKSYEETFPNFLRDLAEAQKAGLTLMQALQSTSKSQYGLLSTEIRRMYNQLTWNIPIERVLESFSERMKKSKTIVRSMMIIDQATKSGGNIEETMESLASNIESLKEVQEEKSTLLNQQVIMMYAIFFIFLGITLILIKFLVPLLQTQVEASGMGFQGFSSNPCDQCTNNPDPGCLGCATFLGVASVFGFGNGDAGAYYRALFFTMIIVQGMFSGLVAGQIGSDSITGGIKHSMIMVLFGFFVFILSSKVGFI